MVLGEKMSGITPAHLWKSFNQKSGRHSEPVFISGECRMGEGFSRQARCFDAGILCVFQGKATKYDGKRPAQAAFNACEYRFLIKIGAAFPKKCFSMKDVVIVKNCRTAMQNGAMPIMCGQNDVLIAGGIGQATVIELC